MIDWIREAPCDAVLYSAECCVSVRVVSGSVKLLALVGLLLYTLFDSERTARLL